ncbi:MAG: di-heme oxidoredictase family protein, partial [Planctomycetota bacterium]
MRRTGFGLSCVLLMTWIPIAGAKSPEAKSAGAIAEGQHLFTQNWSVQNPKLMGRDGLGPLFNGQSCATCHQQGGLGGSGKAEFNAKTISIESMHLSARRLSKEMVYDAVRRFHPGFIRADGSLSNALPLAHHGGTVAYRKSQEALVAKVPALFSDNGGATNAAEVRAANATPILYSTKTDFYEATIRARLFQRNTPALFGAGLIDRVEARELRSIEKTQKSHPEISGRLATLADGRLGRFGWRANSPTLLDFCDRACAAELGLETKRIPQPKDPMVPGYRHPSFDISDAQIRAMASFVATLPAPEREIPTDPERLAKVARGEQLFATVGCAVCHQPNLSVAKGVYSDLLLHD